MVAHYKVESWHHPQPLGKRRTRVTYPLRDQHSPGSMQSRFIMKYVEFSEQTESLSFNKNWSNNCYSKRNQRQKILNKLETYNSVINPLQGDMGG